MSFERTVWHTVCAALAVVLLALSGGAAGTATQEEEPPPITKPKPIAPPGAIEPPPVDRRPPKKSKPLQVRPVTAHCQRCGYVAESGWRHCPACGWDHLALAGDAAGERLEKIQSSAMGVVVLKDKRGVEAVLSPKQLADYRRYRWSTGEGGQRKVFGSALPYGEDGLYVTSARILHRGKSVQLRNFKNHFISAEIVGYDLPSGIGLLKAPLFNLDPPRPADKKYDADERAWVVCFPVAAGEDLVRYLPASIHSGRLVDQGYFGTQLVSHENLLRTDHTLPQGCLGSLLVDSLGMTAGVVLGTPDDGITYSQPVRDVIPIIESLAKGEPIVRPYYGLGLVMPDERRRARFELPPDTKRPVVAFVVGGSPAGSAGARPGDVVTAIDGEEIVDVVQAGALLLGHTPGGPAVSVAVQRGGSPVELMIRPETRGAQVLLDPVDELQEALQTNLVEVKTGKSKLHGLRLDHLVRGGRGENAGWREGDTIRRVSDDSVREFETFNRIARKENRDMFSNEAERLGRPARSTYIFELEVYTAEGETDERWYWNLFPEVLAPPVY